MDLALYEVLYVETRFTRVLCVVMTCSLDYNAWHNAYSVLKRNTSTPDVFEANVTRCGIFTTTRDNALCFVREVISRRKC